MDHAELVAWLRLTGTAGVGPAAARRLLAAFGPPTEIFSKNAESLSRVIAAEQVRALLDAPSSTMATLVETTANWLEAGNGCHRLLTLDDPLYPSALLDIPDPPLVLYALAAEGFWSHQTWPPHSLAVVGSRNPTPQGKDHARRFAHELATQGITIVSGLALGVDGAAHMGALDVDSDAPVTIAVVGTGLDRVYPARHRDLARLIARRGVLISEYPLGTPPLPHHFPQRNRILCGLSDGTLVVEAALQSGSLITARLCADQGKDVFAIPGSIHSPLSKGCHALIREGAKLVESVQDIVEEFPHWTRKPQSGSATSTSCSSELNAGGTHCPVLAALGHDPANLDQLVARTGWNTAALQVRLMELELESMVSRLPGGSFQRVGWA